MLKKIGKILAAIAGGALLVIKAPIVAVGFMAAYASKPGRNEYEKVIFGSIASVLAVILLLNVAELAIAATAFPVMDLLNSWGDHVQAAA